MKNSFVLNKANVNALIALSCSALSHVENERRGMEYEDSATLFHQWSTTNEGTGIRVKGHCAISYPNLKEGNIDRNAIDLLFNEIETNSADKKYIDVRGSIAGKSVEMEFSNNEFLDNNCANGEMAVTKLQQVALGSGFGIQTLIDMVRSQRTGAALNLMGQEDWIQGRVSGHFGGLGLQYGMNQWNGRRLGFAAVGNGSEISVRSANVLDFHDGDYFNINTDSFGHSTGFARAGHPDNHKFQAYGIEGGTQMVGCSALVFDGELDKSLAVDIESCKRRIEKSTLQKFAQRRYVAQPSAEEIAEQQRRIQQQALITKIQNYINKHYPPARRYADRPSVYETGKVAWSREDITRGFVVQERILTPDEANQAIKVTEHRSDVNGRHSVKTYTIKLSDIK